MSKPTYTKREIRRVEVSHGRATLQNCEPPVTCPHCQKKIEIITWRGGVLIEEENYPSPNDPVERLSFIFVPEQVFIEEAYSESAKPALAFRLEQEE